MTGSLTVTVPSAAGLTVASCSVPSRSRMRSRAALPMGILLFGLQVNRNAPCESVTASFSPATRGPFPAATTDGVYDARVQLHGESWPLLLPGEASAYDVALRQSERFSRLFVFLGIRPGDRPAGNIGDCSAVDQDVTQYDWRDLELDSALGNDHGQVRLTWWISTHVEVGLARRQPVMVAPPPCRSWLSVSPRGFEVATVRTFQ